MLERVAVDKKKLLKGETSISFEHMRVASNLRRAQPAILFANLVLCMQDNENN